MDDVDTEQLKRGWQSVPLTYEPPVVERRSVPHRQIAIHWQNQGLKIWPTWNRALESCWRCGLEVPKGRHGCRLERAHIVPHALNGPSEPQNMLLLCGVCHARGPNTRYSHWMFEHLKKCRWSEEAQTGDFGTWAWGRKWLWTVIHDDVSDGRITWFDVGKRYAQFLKNDAIPHAGEGHSIANEVAALQSVVDSVDG